MVAKGITIKMVSSGLHPAFHKTLSPFCFLFFFLFLSTKKETCAGSTHISCVFMTGRGEEKQVTETHQDEPDAKVIRVFILSVMMLGELFWVPVAVCQPPVAL